MAQLVAAVSDVDLGAFRRQLDAKALAQRCLDYLACSNGGLEGLEVREELVAVHHTAAERAIYLQGLNGFSSERKECSELLQLCSHFRPEGPAADAELEASWLLQRRRDAAETARQWLWAAAQRMEAQVFQACQAESLPAVVAEQYAQLLVEVGGALGIAA